MYAAPLALVPLRSATGDWYSDHSTISEAFAVLGSPLTETFASMEAAAALANTAGFAGRSRHEMPHCVKHGIICNAMGRVVYYSAQGATNVTADAPAVKIPGVDNVVLDLLQLPWLVDIHLEGSAVEGRLPDLQELVSLPAMVRSFGQCHNFLRLALFRCLLFPRYLKETRLARALLCLPPVAFANTRTEFKKNKKSSCTS